MFHVKHVMIYKQTMDEIKISSPPGVCDFPASVRAAYTCLNAKLAPTGLGQWLSQALLAQAEATENQQASRWGRRFLFLDCEDER